MILLRKRQLITIKELEELKLSTIHLSTCEPSIKGND